MILHMIQLEPEARLSAESYLQTYVGVVFPNYSPFLHNLYCCWNPLPSDMRVIVFGISCDLILHSASTCLIVFSSMIFVVGCDLPGYISRITQEDDGK